MGFKNLFFVMCAMNAFSLKTCGGDDEYGLFTLPGA